MNERFDDFELLQRFARHGEQSAFADVVRRHLDLVFATALRKLSDPGAAQEVAQNVFTALARKAWQFAPDDSLPAWLHKTALLEAKSWLRGELRRRRREQTAAELGTTMKTLDEQPAFNALVPLLDEALLSLREKDRTALLLRFYESHSLRDVGASLGVGEDAAQKRVQGALEKLSQFFQRRGFKTATVAATTAALQHTAASASAATASAVVSAALQAAPPALAGLTVLFARFASLTKVQTAAVCLAVAAVPVVWQGNETVAAQRTAVAMQTKFDADRERLTQMSADLDRLRAEKSRLETMLIEAANIQARNDEAARKLELLGIRIRGLALAEDYRWPDDLPIVRVPKAIVGQLETWQRYGPTGAVSTPLAELLGLSPEEKRSVEDRLAGFLGNISLLAAQRAFETNTMYSETVPSGTPTKTFVIPALGVEGKSLLNRLDNDIRSAIGSTRAESLLQGLFGEVYLKGQWEYFWKQVAGLGEPQEITVGLRPYGLVLRWGGRYHAMGRHAFDNAQEPLRQLFRPWLAEMGYTNPIPFDQ